MNDAPIVYWLRNDHRLADNPALAHAAASGRPLLPVYILEDALGNPADAPRPPGGAGRWWLHHSLAALARDYAARGSRLLLLRGDPEGILHGLVEATGAESVFWNRRYDAARHRDAAIKESLQQRGIEARSFSAALLHEPWTVRTGDGRPFQVFSQFWRACQRGEAPPPPLPAPDVLPPPPPRVPAGNALEAWELLPARPDWAGGLREAWTPGEAGGRARLAAFVAGALAGYKARRDFPEGGTTSMLSPHLRWGETGPRQVWHAVVAALEAAGARGAGDAEAYLRELGWREFSYHLLFHNPDLPRAPLRPRFAAMRWRSDPAALRAWQRGRTGYPIVDAGMRQLWHTGWMHNRLRMVTASFLVKHLLIPWQEGEAWFWDTLVDADDANNPASWQWVAGCGADAAPYFRIFNPMLQGEKFDPEGAFVRRWVPELAALPREHIHAPWQAPEEVLTRAGVRPGRTYPLPIVDHAEARARALAAFAEIGEAAA